MNARRTVIIYRDELLGGSETFIRAQAESLERFQAFYLGLRRIPGLSFSDSRSHIISGDGVLGKLHRIRFKLFGPGAGLQRELATMRPALVHAHFGPDACNAVLLARRLGTPLVVTFHGYDVTIADEHLPRLYLTRRNALKRAGARFLCVSQYIRDRAIAEGFPTEKALVHYTGIDIQFFTPEPELPRSPIVLFVGRLVAKKGCGHLIRAMARVQKEMPEARLVVIGNGPLRNELERQAMSELKNFQFLGAQEPATVKKWMNQSMVFCTPSITAESGDAEGFGMVFAEAQAMGLPVVSFESGGIPEAVAHLQTGYLVPEKDWERLANRISVLLTDQTLWRSFSEAGRIRARSLFDIRKQATLLENIYESVLSEHVHSSLGLRSHRRNELDSEKSPSAASLF